VILLEFQSELIFTYLIQVKFVLLEIEMRSRDLVLKLLRKKQS